MGVMDTMNAERDRPLRQHNSGSFFGHLERLGDRVLTKEQYDLTQQYGYEAVPPQGLLEHDYHYNSRVLNGFRGDRWREICGDPDARAVPR